MTIDHAQGALVSHPVRVLHVFQGMNRGGAELRTLDLMRSIDRSSMRLDFCTLSGSPGELEPEINRLGGQVYPCKLDWLFPIRFLRLLRDEQYDVVHSHVLLVSGVILLLARVAGVPNRIAHFRSTGPDDIGNPVRRSRDWLLRRLISVAATRILAVSEGALYAVWSRHIAADDRCEVVLNGLNLNEYFIEEDPSGIRAELGYDANDLLLIHVGRLHRAKNHTRLIEIFASILTLQPRAKLLLVGDGSLHEKQRIKNLISEMQLDCSVKVLGSRDDVPRLLSVANAMVFPSLWEGLPGAVLEASVVGLPVVASKIPGVCELQRHFANIVTIDLSCSNTEWAEKVVSVASPPDTNRTMSAVQQAQGTSFDVARTAEAYFRIWSK